MAEVTTLEFIEKKSRDPGSAYCEISNGSWRWEVLKRYSTDDAKQYARWLCNVHGVATEMGDVYVGDVVSIAAQLTSVDGREPTESDVEAFTELQKALSERPGGINIFG